MQMDLFQHARWVHHPAAPGNRPGFWWYKRVFELAEPAVLTFASSADHRYNLYCDGALLGRGPARGDKQHYRYETYTLRLEPGKHLLAAEVACWDFRYAGACTEEGPWGEMHAGGGFICGGTGGGVSLDTPGEWRCAADPSRRFRPKRESGAGCLLSGPMEEHDLRLGLEEWVEPAPLGVPQYADSIDRDTSDTPLWLEPRPIPQMEETPVPAARFSAPGAPLELRDGVLRGMIPAGRTALRIDLGEYRTGFPHLTWAGGAGEFEISYVEAGRRDGKKVRRDDFDAEIFEHGCRDRVRFPEGENEFTPFWYRSGRYLEIVFSVEQPLTEFEFRYDFAGYPFRLLAEISGDASLEAIWQTAWRTARCCAHESYEDCPYYEQMQYISDTRIQALISYAATGDDRLGRQAIRQFDHSRLACGLPQSRYPTIYPQVIPQFGLIWTLMVADHYRYFGDTALVESCRAGVLATLDYFEKLRMPDGRIGFVGFWSITDWTRAWTIPGGWDPKITGTSHRGTEAPETIVALLYAYCCRTLAPVLQQPELEERADRTVAAVNALCFDRERGLYRDVADRPWFSEHAQALAILAGAVAGEDAVALARRAAADPEINRTSLAFAFYLFAAWGRLGLTELMLDRLEDWRAMLELGFTTFPEIPETPGDETRSDCHAWSASPLYFTVALLLGVEPAEPGWRRVGIAPAPGGPPLTGRVPVGNGRILEIWTEPGKIRLRSDSALPIRIHGTDLELAPGRTVEFERDPA